MRAFGYELNRGHAFIGGHGWILTKDDYIAFIPSPVLEVISVIGFLVAFKIAYFVMWGAA